MGWLSDFFRGARRMDTAVGQDPLGDLLNDFRTLATLSRTLQEEVRDLVLVVEAVEVENEILRERIRTFGVNGSPKQDYNRFSAPSYSWDLLGSPMRKGGSHESSFRTMLDSLNS
uniref:Uncharacterized protein n=1 Tax=Rhodosorus marinus TaxID=101924 RepID=A0A7S3A9A3_9RHOD|mmetsp:Transcript_7983/g.35411  ORF Transcript_7983/g.35411 Transcript_7983/m.35411 type:complete len:115 (+) Transcript_7983:28-372(+)